VPYRISYIDTSMSADDQQMDGRLRSEEFATEPAALTRARELLEDAYCKTVLISDIRRAPRGNRCAVKQHA